MGSISDKLLYLNNTKKAIADAIEAKGITIASSDTFRSYADKISSLNNLVIGNLKTCNISYNFQSTFINSPEYIPLIETATPQISYTITNDMFPSLSGDLPASIDYIGMILVGFKNYGASVRNFNYRIKKNGINIINSYLDIPFDNRAVLNSICLLGNYKPVLGDKIDIYLWGGTYLGDLRFDRYALAITPIRIKPVNNPNKLLFNLTHSCTYSSAKMSNFTTYISWSKQPRYYLTNGQFLAPAQDFNFSQLFFNEHETYGIMTVQNDEGISSAIRTNADDYRYDPLAQINSISWQETNIEI